MKFWKGFTKEEIELMKKNAPRFVGAIQEFESMKKFELSLIYQEEIAKNARRVNYANTVTGFVKNIEAISYNEGARIYEEILREYVFIPKIFDEGDDWN